jgi:hypothetical protein
MKRRISSAHACVEVLLSFSSRVFTSGCSPLVLEVLVRIGERKESHLGEAWSGRSIPSCFRNRRAHSAVNIDTGDSSLLMEIINKTKLDRHNISGNFFKPPRGAPHKEFKLLQRSCHPIRVPSTPALAHAPLTHKAHRAPTYLSSLRVLTRAQRTRVHFCPRHWLVCHLGLYKLEFEFEFFNAVCRHKNLEL